MRPALIASLVVGAAAVAASVGLAFTLLGRGPGSVVPVAVAAPAAVVPAPAAEDPSSLRAMIDVGRRARLRRLAPVPAPITRRREIEASLDAGTADGRRAALRGLALADHRLAVELARPRLADAALFAEAARVLLVGDGPVDGADLARVRRELLTGAHDDASETAVSVLVLDTLVALDSPATASFVASLEHSPSPRIRAVAARFAGEKIVRGSASPR